MVKLIIIPEDEYWISKLEDCWEVLLASDDFDEDFFCKLCSKTYELFRHYYDTDKIPKELIRLISVMGTFAYNKKGQPFSNVDIACVVTTELLSQLESGNECRKVIKSPVTGKILKNCEDFFSVLYEDEKYQISTTTFDITPIINREEVEIKDEKIRR